MTKTTNKKVTPDTMIAKAYPAFVKALLNFSAGNLSAEKFAEELASTEALIASAEAESDNLSEVGAELMERLKNDFQKAHADLQSAAEAAQAAEAAEARRQASMVEVTVFKPDASIECGYKQESARFLADMPSIKSPSMFAARVKYHYYTAMAADAEANSTKDKKSEVEKAAWRDIREEYKALIPELDQASGEKAACERDNYAMLFAVILGANKKFQWSGMESFRKSIETFWNQSIDSNGAEAGAQAALRKKLKADYDEILRLNFRTPDDDVYNPSRLHANMQDVQDLLAASKTADKSDKKTGQNSFAEVVTVKTLQTNILKRAVTKLQKKIDVVKTSAEETEAVEGKTIVQEIQQNNQNVESPSMENLGFKVDINAA